MDTNGDINALGRQYINSEWHSADNLNELDQLAFAPAAQ